MKFTVLTLFPEIFDGFKSSSIIGRAVEDGIIDIQAVQIRDYSKDSHKKVDHPPFGGGAGMVMAVQPLDDALQMTKKRSENPEDIHVVYLSPRGKLLNYEKCRQLAKKMEIVLVCGRYEGVDQRFVDMVDEEISIGDYVMTGGEIAAMVVMDSVGRLIDGVLGNHESLADESFAGDLLEYPQYTRPMDYKGMRVPDILLSGHHENIHKWRFEQSVEVTKQQRPDIYRKYMRENSSKKFE